MTEQEQKIEDEPLTPEEEAALEREDAVASLLKRSLPEPAATQEPNILPQVQKKLRQRSRGKFYGDGWSTANTKINYALIALLMLAVVVACYIALGPVGMSAP
jgi:hypothetical protein